MAFTYVCFFGNSDKKLPRKVLGVKMVPSMNFKLLEITSCVTLISLGSKAKNKIQELRRIWDDESLDAGI